MKRIKIDNFVWWIYEEKQVNSEYKITNKNLDELRKKSQIFFNNY